MEFHTNSTAGQVCTVYLQSSVCTGRWLLGQNVGGTLVGGIVFRFSRGQKYKTIEGDEIVRQSKWGDT